MLLLCYLIWFENKLLRQAYRCHSTQFTEKQIEAQRCLMKCPKAWLSLEQSLPRTRVSWRLVQCTFSDVERNTSGIFKNPLWYGHLTQHFRFCKAQNIFYGLLGNHSVKTWQWWIQICFTYILTSMQNDVWISRFSLWSCLQ